MPVGMGARYVCGDEERRAALVRAIANGVAINGIDFLEVIDHELEGTPADESRQRILLVQCFGDALGSLGVDNVRIDGGVRIAPIHVRWVAVLDGITAATPQKVPGPERQFLATYRLGEIDRTRILAIGTEERGDYSTYRLSLVAPGETNPAAGFDPRLASIEFAFKVECPSEFDCKPVAACPPPDLPAPEIDYLAKDYLSFRRLMLDRLAAIIPEWQERNPADLGVALVELLSYVGDQLSYYQDAVATEAYLGTARQRISLRRHARLVDYLVGEGANARACVAFQVEAGSNADGAVVARGSRLLTRLPGRRPVIPVTQLAEAVAAGAQTFETMTRVTLREGLNRLELYTWSNRSCCLPIGATEATLSGHHPLLEPGQFLLFEEVLGPNTGAEADADPTHRTVGRLTRVELGQDPVELVAITEIEWHPADALPFALCVSATTDRDHGEHYLPAVSVARGNVVAVDHGASVVEELPMVPEDADEFRPRLDLGPLVHAAPLPPGDFPAAALAEYSAADAQPMVTLTAATGEVWRPLRDLLASDPSTQAFVAEVDNEGIARLRFGDEVNGRRPAARTRFTAQYRVGLPQDGNVGRDGIGHLVAGPSGITRVRNPMSAFGFRVPEALEEIRRYAPEAFRTQERAITGDDYARAAERHAEVQRAVARFRWTGSWYTVFVSVDRKGGRTVDAAFASELRTLLDRFRMAGVDLEIRPPIFAPLEIRLLVCVLPGYERSAVKRALLDVFANRRLLDGRVGFFHPDNWTFGQTVYLSHIYERAMSVAGVDAVDVEVFKRWARAATTERDDGRIIIGDQEIARLDNDPSLPENGLLDIVMEGGL
jgi:hypothetical protein